ncbi:hypothetical protein CYMTET_4056 [Cymbomonas tetramitiformis]|uniref:Uncharacterized protein n=1 Tax=Cymbomonas tetramitiformis TaxID=36881 RepID=A0AAE0H3R2_9CHLO|nr:hypothetical protein CYMTET_4056 [Cymbomonas tetramitiformis]
MQPSALLEAERALTSQHDAQPQTSAELRTPGDLGPTVQLRLMKQLMLSTEPRSRDGLQLFRYPVPPAHGAELQVQSSHQLVQRAEPKAPIELSWHAAAYAQRDPASATAIAATVAHAAADAAASA